MRVGHLLEEYFGKKRNPEHRHNRPTDEMQVAEQQ